MDLKNLHTNKKPFKKELGNQNLESLQLGKVPPQARDLEAAILGAIMLERNAINTAMEFLKPQSFYADAHQKVFKACLSLNNKSQAIDVMTVVEELKTANELELVGGAFFVSKLTNSVVSSAGLVSHCQIVKQKFVQREILRVAGLLLSIGFDDGTDAFELLELAEKLILEISLESTGQGEMVHMSDVLVNLLEVINKNKANGKEVTGIPSGFNELDKITRGWQNGDLIILAARPAVGKTAFALNIAISAAKYVQAELANNGSIAFFSLEMKSVYLAMRILAAESEIFMRKLQTGDLDMEQMNLISGKSSNNLSKYNIYFDDTGHITLPKLKTKCRRLKAKNNLKMVIIDYLQLMSGEGGNREQEVSNNSRGLKTLAQELDVPILSLSQLSREGAKDIGYNKPPPVSALRESGSLEQDADMVMMLWGPTEQEEIQNPVLKGVKRVKVAKQRNGTLDTIDLSLFSEIQLFKSIDKFSGGNMDSKFDMPF